MDEKPLLTLAEEARLLELEERAHSLSPEEDLELQRLLDRCYGWVDEDSIKP